MTQFLNRKKERKSMSFGKFHIGRNNVWQSIVAVVFATAIIGCAGKVQSSESFVADEHISVSIRSVEIDSGNISAGEFNSRGLRPVIKLALHESGLWSPDGAHILEVQLINAKFRSAGTAIMMGFMAGNDQVDSRVKLKNSQKTLKQFDVRASYGFGGLIGGQDEIRSEWFHKKLAELIVEELKKKG